ncbi:RNA polymerase sigma factor [Frateuria soli]|uniref:RNA polymerase sigma factor n=1 Tax=Frateuria soli TaxID=1542730 RepID=UPI001E3ED497|nr:RNA polymerase sigma factor [Frateuria soli]UGB39731.1 RNA polymerase sigma factor [Frateuria soli]
MPSQHTSQLTTRFEALLRANYGRLQRIARSYAPPGEHEDLLQEILAQMWRSLPGFDDRAPAAAWVYRIALNTALGQLRKRYSRPALHAMDDERLLVMAPASIGDPRDPDALLDAFLGRLGPIDRAVLMLALDDQSYAEIARITGLNPNAVGIRLNRIKQRFQHDYIEEYP